MGDLICIGALLEADEHTAGRSRALHARDREIGRGLAHRSDGPLGQIRAWAEARRKGPVTPDGCAGNPAAVATAAAIGIGLLLGVATALGAFFYDGVGRVNVLLLLALFVCLPGLTLLVAALGAASRHGIRSVSPGRFIALLVRVLPAGGAGSLRGLLTSTRAPRVGKWLVLAWSQWMGLGFGLGALVTALALVVFTDLAFGWSTTLDIGTEEVRRASELLALPWRSSFPGAVPDAALVEASRFFRIAPEPVPIDPAMLGRWWPFVVMAMLTYGVLPRLVALAFCQWRLGRACADALLADLRAHELLDRMNTPLVETRAPQGEVTLPPGPAVQALAVLPPADAWQVVDWAEVPVDEAALGQALNGVPLARVHAAGGARTTGDDERLAEVLGSAPPGTGILVVARAFEPPTLELMDFLAAVRDAAPETVPVLVLPAEVLGGALVTPAPRHTAAWREALSRSGPAGVRAVALHGGVAA